MIHYIHEISAADYNYLRKSVNWAEIEITQAQTGLEHSAFITVAVSDKRPVGIARVVSDGGYIAIIVDVIVLPEFQGKGIGKSMMRQVMEFITGGLCEGQKVFVTLVAAKGRETFYQQFGFIEHPNENAGSGMTQWISKD